jgi:hypothetical protein
VVSLIADVDLPAIMGVGTGFFFVVVLPMVFMLLHHQRRMAELIHRNSTPARDSQIDRLEQEVQELKDRINVLILQSESGRELQERSGPPRVPERLA